MDSLRGFSSGEKCPDNPNQHRVPGSHEGAPGTLQRVAGECQQAVLGGFAPYQGVTPEAYHASCHPESCQERLLLAPRQRKVTDLIWCMFQTSLIPSQQIQDQ